MQHQSRSNLVGPGMLVEGGGGLRRPPGLRPCGPVRLANCSVRLRRTRRTSDRSEPSPGQTWGVLVQHQSRSNLVGPDMLVEGGGFEPPKLSRQIYSLIPLATREPLPKKGLHSLFGPITCQSLLKYFQALPWLIWSWR